MKALITGVNGQDGSYLTKLLLEKDYEVVGVIRNEKSNLNGLKYLGVYDQIELKTINLNIKREVKKIFEYFKPDEVYNFAAQSSVGQSFKHPINTLRSNTTSVVAMLEAIRESDLDVKFYQASSSEMFGNLMGTMIFEDGHFHPASPYGISKAAAHWLTINYREAYNIFACCGILFNHESALRGENFVSSKIIRGAINIKKGKQKKIKLGNLNVYRDWGYAPLYVEAIWSMMQKESPGDYIICSNNIMSLEDFATQVFNHLDLDFNKHVEIDQNLMRAVDLFKMQGNNTRASEYLGWNYKMTNEELIGQLIDDYKKYMEWEEKKN